MKRTSWRTLTGVAVITGTLGLGGGLLTSVLGLGSWATATVLYPPQPEPMPAITPLAVYDVAVHAELVRLNARLDQMQELLATLVRQSALDAGPVSQ
jgi:hypothetical protein